MIRDIEHTVRTALCEKLNGRLRLIPDGGDVRIVIPDADPNGDPLLFVLEEGEGESFITDAGFVYHYLLGATRVADPKAELWRRVEETASRYGFNFAAGEISAPVTDAGAVADGILSLCAVAAEAFGLAHAYTSPFAVRFEEEVGYFLTEASIPFRTGESIVGSSGAKLRVDFLIENTRELVTQAVASENSMRRAVNIFYDLTEGSREYLPIAFVDDAKRHYSNVTFAQLNHKANVFTWGERRRFIDYWASAHRTDGDQETRQLMDGPNG
jgi:hypothetical protein